MKAATRRERVLLVEDDADIVELVCGYLQREGIGTLVARDGRLGLQQALNDSPDLLLLDVALPELDGLEVCRRLRAHTDLPILLLTARSREDEVVIGFDAGADDYVTKPFSPRELVCRVKALLRRGRSAAAAPTGLVCRGNLVLDTDCRQAAVADTALPLTATEFDLLVALARRPGRVFSRAQLMDMLRPDGHPWGEHTIEVHVANVRRKLAGADTTGGIETVRGVGYRWRD